MQRRWKFRVFVGGIYIRPDFLELVDQTDRSTYSDNYSADELDERVTSPIRLFQEEFSSEFRIQSSRCHRSVIMNRTETSTLCR